MGEEVTTRNGHVLGLFLTAAHPPVGLDHRAPIAAIHDQGGLAILAHPFLPYPALRQPAHPAAACWLTPTRTSTPTRSRSSTRRPLGRRWHPQVVAFVAEHGLPRHRRQ